jgi:hypothetical protein
MDSGFGRYPSQFLVCHRSLERRMLAVDTDRLTAKTKNDIHGELQKAGPLGRLFGFPGFSKACFDHSWGTKLIRKASQAGLYRKSEKSLPKR